MAEALPRAMVVDDDPDIRLLVSKRLAHAGFEVRDADSGARAVALFTEFTPDIIFLDCMMPHMDGFETSDKIRALPGGAEIPIAFLTAHGTLDNHKKAMEHGSNDFISKPVGGTELVHRAKSLLRMKRMADDLRRQHTALDDADAQRRNLLDSIHHRLGVPIADIQANAKAIQERPGADDATKRMAGDIVHSVQGLEKMVAGLLQRAASK